MNIAHFDTARDYNLQFSITHLCLQSRLHCRYLLAASNGGRFPSFEFPNCPRPQLEASNSNNSQRLNPTLTAGLSLCQAASGALVATV
jgi:hypothetical protein